MGKPDHISRSTNVVNGHCSGYLRKGYKGHDLPGVSGRKGRSGIKWSFIDKLKSKKAAQVLSYSPLGRFQRKTNIVQTIRKAPEFDRREAAKGGGAKRKGKRKLRGGRNGGYRRTHYERWLKIEGGVNE